MGKLITLYEAASYLEVSKSTLRNWDREGKLKAQRHPINNYRLYDIEELQEIKQNVSNNQEYNVDKLELKSGSDKTKDLKKLIAKLHNIIRDSEGNSNIVLRFDELTKLIFIKLFAEKDGKNIFVGYSKDKGLYCKKIKDAYEKKSENYSKYIPKEYSSILCNNNTIIKCGEILSTYDFSQLDLDIKGLMYEEVIKGTFDKNDNQQFFTPQTITSFMVDMMLPFISGNICDPACGTGGFLIETLKSECSIDKIFGLEIDSRLQWISGINLLLHGGEEFIVECSSGGGSLGKMGDQYVNKMNTILTNPPFGSDVTDINILEKYKLGAGKNSRRRGVLFIERCFQLLRESGCLGIVIDEGILNSTGNKDVRNIILNNFDVLAIINLPDSAFLPYASVSTSIMILRKGRSKEKIKTFFAKAEHIGRKANGDDDYIYDNTGKKRVYSDFPHIIEQWYKFIDGETIEHEANIYVSDINACILEEQSNRLDFQFHHYTRDKYKKLMKMKEYEFLPLVELCNERNDSVVPSANGDMAFIQYTGLANICAYNGKVEQVLTAAESIKSAVKRYEKGDIIFARMRPNLRKVALMDFDEGGFVSPECSILSVKKKENGEDVINKEYLTIVLRSDVVFSQLLYKVSGVGRPRLSQTDLRKVMIPILDIEKQKELVLSYKSNMKFAEQLIKQANQMMEQVHDIETKIPTKLIEEVL